MATKKNNPYDEAGKKTSDLLKKFAEMMIKIIEKGKGEDWKKGWLGTAGKFKGLPQNINGRTYSGSNSFFLSFHTADNNYKAPVYMTFNQAKNQELRINAGEKSVPVFKWSRTIKDENNNKISEEEYNAMSQEEREKLTIRTYPRSFNVFNIDQTNLKEANKEKYDSIVSRFEVPQEVAKDTKGMYVNEAMDRMFEKQEWHSKIQYDQPSDQAYYNPSNDRIVLPMKEQFNKGETPEEKYQGGQAYYATALHEMAHSTGHPTRLNRTFEGKFGSSKYAHEELIAETTSALVGSAIGFDKKITENSGNYLSGWLKTLRKTPEMIANIMSDVSKAADMIIAKIDEQRIALGQKPLKSEDSENIDENINERENKEIETKPAFTEEQKLYKESPQTTAAEKSAENDIYVSKYLGSGTLSEAKDVYWVDPEENVSLSEDNDPKTDLASVTEKIMESNHVSKEQAAKMAAPIVEQQVAVANEKKQKAEQVKQESIKKADEAKRQEDQRRREAEAQRQRQEENSRHDKNDGYTSKIVLHAALLLGALELAKGNKGIWMNKAGKSNAEFLGQKTPVSPYNNVMMNLHSDQKGYSTNVYTSFADLKKSDDYVKTNEKSLPFNWTHWDYQNIATKEIIEKDEYNKLPEEEKSLYTKHSTRQTFPVFNIEQTSLTSKEIYGDILKENGIKFEKLSERGVSSMMKFAEKLKENHPTALVIAKHDNGYRMYGKDATKTNKVLGLTLTKTELNGEEIKYTSFPHDRLDSYLPKLIQAKQWVVVADSLDSAELIRGVPDEKEILNKAYSSVQKFAKAAGIDYERVLVLQDSEYDKANDKIVISGKNYSNTGNKRQAAIEKANDIYRTMVAATGSEQRLDRMGRNNLLPKDDTKHERFVQDIAAGILMARQGLPAMLSKESMQHIDYWKREINENPKLMSVLEKDVNNAIESIDKHIKQEVVMYKTIRDGLPPKDLAVDARQYQISSDLAKLPDIDSKEIVIVKDKAKGSADVILPEGASLEENVEISGIRKDRIRIALGKEGFNDVKFYNAGGAFALKETNDYYKDKTIVTGRLKQYEFVPSKEIDVKPQIEAAAGKKIDIFTHIRDDKGQYAFFIKPENEPSFSIYPNDLHKRAYFDAIKTDQKADIHNALAQKYYAVANKNPEVKVELVMPKVEGIDMNKIERPTITKDREDPNKKYVTATVDGQFMKKEISKDQWNKMWLADDMAAYKRAVAAITFAPSIKEDKAQEVHQEEKQTTQQEVTEKSVDDKEEQSQSVEAKADTDEQSEEVQTEAPQKRKGIGV